MPVCGVSPGDGADSGSGRAGTPPAQTETSFCTGFPPGISSGIQGRSQKNERTTVMMPARAKSYSGKGLKSMISSEIAWIQRPTPAARRACPGRDQSATLRGGYFASVRAARARSMLRFGRPSRSRRNRKPQRITRAGGGFPEIGRGIRNPPSVMEPQDQPGRKHLRDDEKCPCLQRRNEREQACELKPRRNPDQGCGEDAAEQGKPDVSRPELGSQLIRCEDHFRVRRLYTARCIRKNPGERDDDSKGCEKKRKPSDGALEAYIPHVR